MAKPDNKSNPIKPAILESGLLIYLPIIFASLAMAYIAKPIKGTKNIVADALSRLDINPDSNTSLEYYGLEKDDLPEDAFPLTYYLLNREQTKDESLLMQAQNHKHYALKPFHGGGTTTQLICYKDKIVVPKTLQN